MSFLYETNPVLNAFHPVNLSSWAAECFSIMGFNSMQGPALGYPGTSIQPSWTFFGDERTGLYSYATGVVAITLTAFPSFLFASNSFTFVDKFGFELELTTAHTTHRTQTFQDKDGIIALLEDLEDYILMEAPTPSPDGIVTVFTLPSAAKKILNVFINGLGNNTYTHTTGNSTLTINSTITGDSIYVEYIKNF